MNNNLAIKIEHLTKTFDGLEVVKNCNMNVPQGKIYGFLGANGAGKTTVFKILSGLLTPTAGTVIIDGNDITIEKNKILQKIGSVNETPVFYEHLSATENLKIHLTYMGSNNIEDIEKTLIKVGLFNTGEQPVSKFSLGMRQRLAIARAIIHKPTLLILDEPINGLDPMGIKEMRELFVKLSSHDNVTLLISSHILSEIEHIADVVGVIVNGTIVEEVLLSDIKKQTSNGLENYFFELMSGGVK